MILRIIRRAPWIALGAAAAYYCDGENGAARRARAMERLRDLTGQTAESGADAGFSGDAPPLAPSVPAEAVRSRAETPLAEETAAGVDRGAAPAMAHEILRESEQRVTDPAPGEQRASEETVAPTDPASASASRRD